MSAANPGTGGGSDDPLRDLELRLDTGVLPKKPLRIAGGKGCDLVGADGRPYLDMGASYGVCPLGHGHPAVQEALGRAADLPFAHFTYPHEERARLYERLTGLTGLDRVFPANSGAEAVEAAVKLAYASTDRSGLVALKGAFHGRTLGALALTWRPPYRKPFEGLLAEATFVDAFPGAAPGGPDDPDAAAQATCDALHDAITEETALFIAEPVQGEGGVRPVPAEVLRAARDRCDEVGAVLCVDEVQTGLGRTGATFAFERAGVRPDVVCLGKGLGNGYPVAACVVADRVADVPARSHGGTFNGSPLACAVANAVLDAIEREDLAARAARLGDLLLERLDGLVGDGLTDPRQARGAGLMAAVELRRAADPVLAALAGRGVLALSAGRTVVRFLPPLVVTDAEIDRAVDALAGALGDIPAGAGRQSGRSERPGGSGETGGHRGMEGGGHG